MHCEGCANTVKRACARIPGVAKYTVDYPAQKVTVTGNVNRDQVLKRILKTGKHAEVEPEKSQKQEARKEDKKLVEPKEEKKKLEEPKVQVNKEEKKQEVKKAEAPKEDPHPVTFLSGPRPHYIDTIITEHFQLYVSGFGKERIGTDNSENTA
ncbi:hypothetical protein KC19_2G001800 [Ceratodon purpureus]|uniref:HMA domain-containing protein n=1 Tax=Ceratodon purpureus TaxID=3225 RepID=A0A8T0ING4_CERPU|nr:hypothetical protein KC19_2G001800 [Ceratodon purpureus]